MSDRDKRSSIIDALRAAWDILPDTQFGMLLTYIFEGEETNYISDDQTLTYLNDFVLNNM